MSLNTLETAYVNGQVIDASHVNELTLALLGALVGRDASGVPTPGQNLGTLAIPWGNMYGTGLILNGLAVDTEQITSLPNRIISGKVRALSSMPDFLKANGAALEFTIEGLTTNLVLSINNIATSVASDLVKTGVIAAPAANNTAAINDANISNNIYAGEEDANIKEITIGTVGSEITARVGQIIAFKTPTGEIFQGLLNSSTLITNCFRGYYFDDSGVPIVRGNLSNADTITLLNIGWVFIEDNGTTIDLSYTTPVISYQAPTSPSTGDYWLDISNQVWKRYSGVSWEIINRILIGQVVSDDTNTIASRSNDFSNQYSEENNVTVNIFSTEIIETIQQNTRANVYGKEVMIDSNKLVWNITTDLESPLTEAISTDYYLYLSSDGQTIISTERPYYRADLKGHYHPYHSWRCVGLTYNDASSDFVLSAFVPYNSEIFEQEIVISDHKASGNHGGTFTADGNYQTRDLNTVKYKGKTNATGLAFIYVDSNEMYLPDGNYNIIGSMPGHNVYLHKGKILNVDDSIDEIIGTSESSNNDDRLKPTRSVISGNIVIDKTKKFKAMHRAAVTRGTDGFGFASSFGDDEVYTELTIKKVRG